MTLPIADSECCSDVAMRNQRVRIAFGGAVTDAREGLALNVPAAAEQAGVSASAWLSIELGCGTLASSLLAMRSLVAAGVSAHWLITGEGEMGGD